MVLRRASIKKKLLRIRLIENKSLKKLTLIVNKKNKRTKKKSLLIRNCGRLYRKITNIIIIWFSKTKGKAMKLYSTYLPTYIRYLQKFGIMNNLIILIKNVEK